MTMRKGRKGKGREEENGEWMEGEQRAQAGLGAFPLPLLVNCELAARHARPMIGAMGAPGGPQPSASPSPSPTRAGPSRLGSIWLSTMMLLFFVLRLARSPGRKYGALCTAFLPSPVSRTSPKAVTELSSLLRQRQQHLQMQVQIQME